MAIWTGAVVFSGLSQEFWTLLIARSLTGFGEASFLSVASPLIDFFAPDRSRSTYLAIFYAAIPIGYAMGATVGGLSGSLHMFPKSWRWRCAYFLEALVTAPLVMIFATIRGPESMEAIEQFSNSQNMTQEIVPPNTQRTEESDGTLLPNTTVAPTTTAHTSKWTQLKADLLQLITNRLYVLIVLGYATQTFFVGAAAVFGVEYISKVYGFSKGKAGITFGLITGSTGLFGSAIGGYILDRTKPQAGGDAKTHTIEMLIAAHRLMIVCSVVTAPAAVVGFLMGNVWAFVGLLFVGELGVFMMIGPINSSIIWCLPIALQPTGVAMNTLAIHLLGDALSPIVIGALTDSIGRRHAMLVSAFMLVWPVLLFCLSMLVCQAMKRDALRTATV
eukprot:c16391_g1_i1.p1 GENE.c16391_g1_i1~~c16391_g1_i1.p1  ORF type:complete len:389 (-),score=87.39 c16391_g1_i1:9-1175(-)